MEIEEKGGISRRQLLSPVRLSEACALLPLVAAGLANHQKQRTWHELDLSGAKLTAPTVNQGPIITLSNAHGKLVAALELLSDAYSAAYLKTTAGIDTSVDADGNLTITPTVDTEWEIPEKLPDITKIQNWKASAEDFQTKIDYLTTAQLVDVEELRQIGISAKNGSQLSERALVGLAYGGLAAGTLFYEEIYARVLATLSYDSYQKTIESISSPSRIKARDFLKFGAALAGSAIAYLIGKSTDRSLDKSKDRLGRLIEAQEIEGKQHATRQIHKYFGKTLEEIRSMVTSQTDIAYAAIESGVIDPKVKRSFMSIVNSGSELLNALSPFLGDPNAIEIQTENSNYRAFGHLCACGNATKALDRSSPEALRASLGTILEGLGVAGAMALIIGVGEKCIAD